MYGSSTDIHCQPPEIGTVKCMEAALTSIVNHQKLAVEPLLRCWFLPFNNRSTARFWCLTMDVRCRFLPFNNRSTACFWCLTMDVRCWFLPFNNRSTARFWCLTMDVRCWFLPFNPDIHCHLPETNK